MIYLSIYFSIYAFIYFSIYFSLYLSDYVSNELSSFYYNINILYISFKCNFFKIYLILVVTLIL